MLRGETVRCLVHYDLFDFDIKGKEGCFISYTEFNKKYLIYFPEPGEWAELLEEQFERVNKPGHIAEKFRELSSSVEKLSSNSQPRTDNEI